MRVCYRRAGSSCRGLGMPKLDRDILNAAFYLYGKEPKPNGGTKITGPWGTGGVVARRVPDTNRYHFYGITNRHIAHSAGASIIQVNTADGKTRRLDYEPHDWQFIPQQDDLAAIDITDDIKSGDQISFVSEDVFISQAAFAHYELSPGDDVFMVGLFANAHGGHRNVPCVRFGNISMTANENALIKQPHGIRRPSYLTDMRSRGGFSGSPVFVYRNPVMDLDRKPGAPLPLRHYPKFLGLLGIHCSQFWEPIKVSKKPPKPNEQAGDLIREGDTLYVQSAMNVVIPACRISEILDLEVFEMARKKRKPLLRDEAMKDAQPESAEASLPASDENPNHRGDFMRLVDAAGQRREPKD